MSLDLVIMHLAGTYKSSDEDTKAIVNAAKAAAVPKVRVPKEAKPKVMKDPKVKDPKEATVTTAWVGVGDKDHAAFLKNIRAGKNREEYIKAIDQYCGYNTAENFGAQEMQAIAAARLALRPPVKDPIFVPRRIEATVKGFVAGLPEEKSKHKANLEARERLAAETMAEFGRLAEAAQAAGNEMEAEYQHSLATVERGRLNQIQADLRNLK